jgi:tetratricopeptide (TPR) repeat protein
MNPEESGGTPLPPAPIAQEKIDQAEALIRQAQICKMRGETQKAGRLLQEAAQAAPTSPAVLEIVGDSCMERRDYKGAIDVYAQALLASQGSVPLERKHAEAILAHQMASNPMLIPTNDVGTYAQGKYAVLLSIIFPGVGHMIAGKWAPGIVFMSLVLVGSLMSGYFGGYAAFLSLFGSSRDVTFMGILSLLILVGSYLACQFHMASLARQMETPKIERPKPPVDKEF